MKDKLIEKQRELNKILVNIIYTNYKSIKISTKKKERIVTLEAEIEKLNLNNHERQTD